MTPIGTYIFMDLTTEWNEVNKITRITGVSLLAEQRSQYLETDDSKVAPQEMRFRLFGNHNSDDDQPVIDMTTFYDFISFINEKETPVCFISHDEGDIDVPIMKLQEQLQEFDVSLPNNVMWADGLTAFRYILENKNWKPVNISSGTSNYNGSVNQGDHLQKATGLNNLKDIYQQVVASSLIQAYSPENNITMMFKISQVFGRFFLAWVDQNQRYLIETKDKDFIIERKRRDKEKVGHAKLGVRYKLKPSSTSLC